MWARSVVDGLFGHGRGRGTGFSFSNSSGIRPLKLSQKPFCILHRLARRDEVPFHLMILRPAEDRVRGELGAVGQRRSCPLAAPGDQFRPFTRHPAAGDRSQAFARHVVDNVEDAEALAAGELIMDEI